MHFQWIKYKWNDQLCYCYFNSDKLTLKELIHIWETTEDENGEFPIIKEIELVDMKNVPKIKIKDSIQSTKYLVDLRKELEAEEQFLKTSLEA